MPYFSCACFLLLDHFHLASNAHDTQKPICLDGKEKTWNINTKHCHRQVIRNQRKLRGGFFLCIVFFLSFYPPLSLIPCSISLGWRRCAQFSTMHCFFRDSAAKSRFTKFVCALFSCFFIMLQICADQCINILSTSATECILSIQNDHKSRTSSFPQHCFIVGTLSSNDNPTYCAAVNYLHYPKWNGFHFDIWSVFVKIRGNRFSIQPTCIQIQIAQSIIWWKATVGNINWTGEKKMAPNIEMFVYQMLKHFCAPMMMISPFFALVVLFLSMCRDHKMVIAFA